MQYVIKKCMETKLLKIAIMLFLTLCIITTTFYLDYQEVHATPLVLAGILIPEAVQIIGALLVAAGLTYATNEAIDYTANWYWSEIAPEIRDGVFSMVESASNGIASVSQNVWNSAVEWVNSNFNVGENTVTRNYYTGAITITYGSEPVTVYLPVNYNVGSTELPIGIPANTLFNIGNDVYEFRVWNYIGTNKEARLYKNDVSEGMTYIINTAVPYAFYIETYVDSGVSRCRFRLRSAGYNATEWNTDDGYVGAIPISGASVLPNVPGSNISQNVTGQTVVGTSHDIVQQDGVTRMISYPTSSNDLLNKEKSDVVINTVITPFSDSWEGTFRDCVPTGEYIFEGTGTATIGYETAGTWEGIWTTDSQTGARVWTGTFTDASANTWEGVITGVVPDTRTWLEDLLSGQLIAGTLAQIRDAVQGVAAPIVAAITGTLTAAVDGVKTAVNAVEDKVTDTDINPKMREFHIGDLFLIFLDVLLACIALVIRACIYLATIVTIPADASLLNSHTISGIDFFKNQNIPVLNISVWNLFSGFMTLIISLSVVKKVRRDH